MLEKSHNSTAVMMSQMEFDLLKRGRCPSSYDLGRIFSEMVKERVEWLREKNWHGMMNKMFPPLLTYFEIENPDPSKYCFLYDKNIFGPEHNGLVTVRPRATPRKILNVEFCGVMKAIRMNFEDVVASSLYDYSLTSNILAIHSGSSNSQVWELAVFLTPSYDGQSNIDADLIQQFVDLQKDLKVV